MCKEFGIGIIEVDADRFEWHDRARTAFRRVVDADRVIAACVPENEAESGSLVAGSRGGGYSTPFSRTVERISRFVAAREKLTDQPVLVRDALTMVEHHYSSLSSARSALVALAHARKILPLRVVQRGRDMYFTTQPEERTNGN
jgi:hypothetical protein